MRPCKRNRKRRRGVMFRSARSYPSHENSCLCFHRLPRYSFLVLGVFRTNTSCTSLGKICPKSGRAQRGIRTAVIRSRALGDRAEQARLGRHPTPSPTYGPPMDHVIHAPPPPSTPIPFCSCSRFTLFAPSTTTPPPPLPTSHYHPAIHSFNCTSHSLPSATHPIPTLVLIILQFLGDLSLSPRLGSWRWVLTSRGGLWSLVLQLATYWFGLRLLSVDDMEDPVHPVPCPK